MEKNSDIYSGFAEVYDMYMDDTPYEEWHDYIISRLKDNNINNGQIVELACGTAVLSRMFHKDGYRVVGIDISPDMLSIASSRCEGDVLFLEQDMRNIDLPFKAKVFICMCDSINYILNEKDMLKVFKGVYRHLEKGGLFIFDMKSEHLYKEVLADNILADNRENGSYIWDNSYDEETCINEYLLTTYKLVDKDNNIYARYDEIHTQRAYTVEEIKRFAELTDFEVREVSKACSDGDVEEDTERISFILAK